MYFYFDMCHACHDHFSNSRTQLHTKAVWRSSRRRTKCRLDLPSGGSNYSVKLTSTEWVSRPPSTCWNNIPRRTKVCSSRTWPNWRRWTVHHLVPCSCRPRPYMNACHLPHTFPPHHATLTPSHRYEVRFTAHLARCTAQLVHYTCHQWNRSHFKLELVVDC